MREEAIAGREWSIQQREQTLHALEAKHIEAESLMNSRGRVELAIINNLTRVLKALVHNSPFRRPLIGELSVGLEWEESNHVFCVSKSTFDRARERDLCLPKEKNPLWAIQYHPKTKHKRHVKEIARLAEVLDDIAPMSSARTFRVCTTTKKKFYEQYRAALQEGEHALSKRYVLKGFLARRHQSVTKKKGDIALGGRIHWVKDASHCKHCSRYQELKEKKEREGLTDEEEQEFKLKELHDALVQAQ